MGCGILGGTFNPVHNGHVRLALETGEALGLGTMFLMPCARPPHKPDAGLLPFELRLALVQAAVEGVPGLKASGLEGQLQGPSYTARMLEVWQQRHEEKAFFIVGVEDFAQMPAWNRGLQLPQLGRMTIAARGGAGRERFFDVLNKNWPEYRKMEPAETWKLAGLPGTPAPGLCAALVPPDGLCLYLPVPRLDISASDIRGLWLKGRSATGLVPEKVLALLEKNKAEVSRIWRKKPCAAEALLLEPGACRAAVHQPKCQ